MHGSSPLSMGEVPAAATAESCHEHADVLSGCFTGEPALDSTLKLLSSAATTQIPTLTTATDAMPAAVDTSRPAAQSIDAGLEQFAGGRLSELFPALTGPDVEWKSEEAADRVAMTTALDQFFKLPSSKESGQLDVPDVGSHCVAFTAARKSLTQWTSSELSDYDMMTAAICKYFPKGLEFFVEGLKDPPQKQLSEGNVHTSLPHTSLVPMPPVVENTRPRPQRKLPEQAQTKATQEMQRKPLQQTAACTTSAHAQANVCEHSESDQAHAIAVDISGTNTATKEGVGSEAEQASPKDQQQCEVPGDAAVPNKPCQSTSVSGQAPPWRTPQFQETLVPEQETKDSSEDKLPFTSWRDEISWKHSLPLDQESMCLATAGGSTRSYSVASMSGDLPELPLTDTIEIDDLRQMDRSRSSLAMYRMSPLPMGRCSTDLQYSPSLPSISPWPMAGSRPGTSDWPKGSGRPDASPAEGSRRPGTSEGHLCFPRLPALESPSLWPLAASPSQVEANQLWYESPGAPQEHAEIWVVEPLPAIPASPDLDCEATPDLELFQHLHQTPHQQERPKVPLHELRQSNNDLRQDVEDLKAEVERRRLEFTVWQAALTACKDSPLPPRLLKRAGGEGTHP